MLLIKCANSGLVATVTNFSSILTLYLVNKTNLVQSFFEPIFILRWISLSYVLYKSLTNLSIPFVLL